MILNQLYTVNYKNIKNIQLSLSQHINCFVGDNASGKTNLLDSIYHLGLAKSYFNTNTAQNINIGQDFFLIEGTFTKNNRQETITCSAKKNQNRILKKNGKPYEKISDHIGQFPIVIVSPYDINLIYEGSEQRRKFIDSIISQINSQYLSALISYNKTLLQRNSLLKQHSAGLPLNHDILSIYNDQLSHFAQYIFQERTSFMQHFLSIFKEQYNQISAGKESVNILYESHLQQAPMLSLLQNNLDRDLSATYTTHGIHKDDFSLIINDFPIKKFGSQGQQKSYLTALKLAQFIIIKEKTSITPILLLDDIFDKLDSHRVSQLLTLVSQPPFGQIFLSHTSASHTENIVKTIFPDYKIFNM